MCINFTKGAKPMSRKLKIVLITVAVLMLAFVLTACGNKGPETPWEWAQGLEDGDIESATFWCKAEYYEQQADSEDAEDTEDVEDAAYEDTETELSEKLVGKLITNFYRLEEDNFTEIDAVSDSPLYGIKFTTADGDEYALNQCTDTDGALEITYADKVWMITGAKLNAFVEAILNGEDVENMDDEVASSANLIASGSDLNDPSFGFVTYSDLVE